MGADVGVSVIIPAYNYAGFLDQCLESVYQQSCPDYEIIVVDDGSTDVTPEVLRRHRDRIVHIRQDNMGQAAARNTGLKASRGKYIQFLDADDLLPRHALKEKLAFAKQASEFEIGVCRTRKFSDLAGNGAVRWAGWWRLYTRQLDIHLCRLNVAPPHAYLFPRQVFDVAGLCDESYRGCEDYDLVLKALGAGYHYSFSHRPQVYYRVHSASRGELKARGGAYPFDVLVHQKKHEGAYGPGVEAILRHPAAMLALADGALRSALKISPQRNKEGIDILIEIAGHWMDRALADNLMLTREVSLYVYRILVAEKGLRQRGITRLDAQLDALHRSWSTAGRRLAVLKLVFPATRYEQQALLSAMIGGF